jgi:hypothetical protein
VVVSAKSTSDPSKLRSFPPDPNSQDSTISTVEKEIREAGGEATAIPVDTRKFESVQELIEKAIEVKRLSFCRVSRR